MSLSISQVLVLSVAWLVYFVVHSVLASLGFKAWLAEQWPALDRYYRLLYNGFALVSLLPLLYLLVLWHGEPIWQWHGPWRWLNYALTLAAAGGFFLTLKYYDGGEFLGLKSLRGKRSESSAGEGFVLSPMHRFVRHPWYFLGLVLIWTREMDLAFLLSATLMTGYFIVGSLLEERKLVAQLGNQYADYRRQVPGLLPLPWKYLSREAAAQMSASRVCSVVSEKKPKK